MNQRGVPEPKEKLDYNMLEIALYGTIQLVAAYGDEICRAYRFHLFDLRVGNRVTGFGRAEKVPGECDGLVIQGSPKPETNLLLNDGYQQSEVLLVYPDT